MGFYTLAWLARLLRKPKSGPGTALVFFCSEEERFVLVRYLQSILEEQLYVLNNPGQSTLGETTLCVLDIPITEITENGPGAAFSFSFKYGDIPRQHLAPYIIVFGKFPRCISCNVLVTGVNEEHMMDIKEEFKNGGPTSFVHTLNSLSKHVDDEGNL